MNVSDSKELYEEIFPDFQSVWRPFQTSIKKNFQKNFQKIISENIKELILLNDSGFTKEQ